MQSKVYAHLEHGKLPNPQDKTTSVKISNKVRCLSTTFKVHGRIPMDYKPFLFALIYMICSSGIIFSNKIVLTNYRFPSFLVLALAQTLFTFLLVRLLFFSQIGPSTITSVFPKVFPLSCFYAMDIVMGIAGTGSLSLPMFSALRRISNLFILIGERILLRVFRPMSVYAAVCLMVFGATVAAIGDLTFELTAYAYVFANNVSTASKALLTKSRLRDQGFSSVELLYYNSGFMIPFLAVIVLIKTDLLEIVKFSEWTNPVFVVFFLFSCCSAVLLNYSLLQCTHYTSALTTSIIGVIKNVLVTYAGMFVGGDYVYSLTNFIGVTISAIGAVMYVIVVYRHTAEKSRTEKGGASLSGSVTVKPVEVVNAKIDGAENQN